MDKWHNYIYNVHMDKNITKKDKIKKLFFSTFYLSACTFGGGYVIVSFMKQIFVDELHWIGEEEMLDLIAIAQSSPGAVAVNGAIVVGYKIAGIPGVIASILGAILPPFIILSIITGIYHLIADNPIVSAFLRGMQAGVAAIIASVTIDMTAGVMKNADSAMKRSANAILLVVAFIANYFFGVSAVWIILTCGILGLVLTLLTLHRNHTKGSGQI